MKITADTNLLLRLATEDDPAQARMARAVIERAELIAVPIPALCELVWVMRRGYRRTNGQIAEALRRLLAAPKVRTDRASAAAGLAALEAGGDFADGSIAAEGRRLGGTIFTSFDRQAVSLVKAAGGESQLLTSSSQGH